MAKRRLLWKLLCGILIGTVLSQFFASKNFIPCSKRHLVPLQQEEERASNQSLLFAGVMTAKQYLDLRAKAVYETWGKQVPGKIMFYSSEYSLSTHVPLVALPGVDDSYPPQRKSFMMLKHIHDNYLDQYEWFLRADDDVYVRTDLLEKLLRSVDSRKPWFIGQTGRGNSEEFGLLSLDSDENFCMGGPGIIMSRETLRRVAPYLEKCLGTLYTDHEDVELGRCVKRFAGISCTWSYEMQVIFYHNQSGQNAFSGDLKLKEVHRAITLHPVKKPSSMYRLHGYLKGLKIQEGLQNSVHLHRDIAKSMKELGYRINRLENATLLENVPLFPGRRGSEDYLGDTSILGVQTDINRYKPHNLKGVLEWELIAKTLYSHKDFNPRRRIGSSLKEGLNDIVREIMDIINSFSKQRGRVIDFKEILYGYWRVDPLYGADLILDLLLVYKKYRGHKMTVQVRRHAYLQQTFTGIFIREVEEDPKQLQIDNLPVHKKIVHQIFSKINENLVPLFNFSQEETVVNMILPLSGRFETFKRFLNNFQKVCSGQEAVRLFVVLSKDSSNSFWEILNLIESVRSDKIVVIKSDSSSFARAQALQKGVDMLSDKDLMMFIDVDMLFNENSLRLVRSNTVFNKTVYFPIVYSLYNPKLLGNGDDIQVDEVRGFWRQFGFGIVGIYKSDYVSLGGLNLSLTGWGNEDVLFYDNVVKSNKRIVRSTDPGLVHVFHPVECEGLQQEQKTMCIGTKASTLGAWLTVKRLLLKYKFLFR